VQRIEEGSSISRKKEDLSGEKKREGSLPCVQERARLVREESEAVAVHVKKKGEKGPDALSAIGKKTRFVVV